MTTYKLHFHTPPECQGQIVTRSYADAHDGHVVEQSHDASDGSTSYRISRQIRGDEGDYWNRKPLNFRWRELTPAELRKYQLS